MNIYTYNNTTYRLFIALMNDIVMQPCDELRRGTEIKLENHQRTFQPFKDTLQKE